MGRGLRTLAAALGLSVLLIAARPVRSAAEAEDDFEEEPEGADQGDGGEYDDDAEGGYDDVDGGGEYVGGDQDYPVGADGGFDEGADPSQGGFDGLGFDEMDMEGFGDDFSDSLDAKLASMGSAFPGADSFEMPDMGDLDQDLDDASETLPGDEQEAQEGEGEGGEGARGPPRGERLPLVLPCEFEYAPTMKKTAELEGNVTALGITKEQYDAFWDVQDMLTDHMGEVFGKDGKVDATADVVGALLYDAILLDTSQSMRAAAKAAMKLGQAPKSSPLPPKHEPTYGKVTKKLLKKLAKVPTPETYKGLPVRAGSAQLAVIQVLSTFSTLAAFIHGRMRSTANLTVPEEGRPAVRGITCLFLASGRTPFEGAWEAPGATTCMVMDADDPLELVTIGNVFCNSALATRAQVTATLDRIATGMDELEGLLVPPHLAGSDEEGGGKEENEKTAAVRASLETSVVSLLHAYDREIFGQDAAPEPSPEATRDATQGPGEGVETADSDPASTISEDSAAPTVATDEAADSESDETEWSQEL